LCLKTIHAKYKTYFHLKKKIIKSENPEEHFNNLKNHFLLNNVLQIILLIRLKNLIGQLYFYVKHKMVLNKHFKTLKILYNLIFYD
jgi:hypothetical protein